MSLRLDHPTHHLTSHFLDTSITPAATIPPSLSQLSPSSQQDVPNHHDSALWQIPATQMKSHSFEPKSAPLGDSESMTISRRSTAGGMLTGSADDGKSNGLSQSPAPSGGGGHSTSGMQSSPIVAALVVVAIVLLGSILAWWIISRIRRSRRGRPSAPLKEACDCKPVLSDVILGHPSATKDLYHAQWEKLTPISADCASEDDRRRWQSLSEDSPDDISLSTSSQSYKSKTAPFSLFSRASSPATTLTPDMEPVEVKVTIFIAMPSQHASQFPGELCIGVSQSPLL
ncbi:hypothetical protein C2E23DRAFT_827096 [Lenzites betulinus]|nr:hypothetical protein C2E23DRAFT_827096 [Lenzites betulinus]